MTSELAIATLNAHGRAPHWRQRRAELVRQLSDLDVDAIALQELRTWPSHGGWLARSLPGASYTFIGARKQEWREWGEGIGVVTRLPVAEREVIPLGFGGRIAVRCRLQTRPEPFDFYSVHFHHGPDGGDARLEAATRLLRRIEHQRLPAIVAGDTNGPPTSRAMQLLTARLSSAYATVHGAEPASTVYPLAKALALDYILVTEDIKVLDARIAFDQSGPTGETISDHMGIVARLRFGSIPA